MTSQADPALIDDASTSWRIYVPPVSIPERIHADQHRLLWQVRGQSHLVLHAAEWALTSGHALWVPAGTAHSGTVHANSVMLPMFFAVAQTATTLRQPTLITVDRDLRTLFLAQVQTQYTIIQPSADIARQIQALIEERPVSPSNLPMPTTKAALLVAQTLRFNPGDDRSLAQLAESVHTSARTIERAFRAETGMTLRQWRIRSRMEAAAMLLRSADSLQAVAYRVGYTNASAFRRVFKEHFGMAPSEYVARYKVEP